MSAVFTLANVRRLGSAGPNCGYSFWAVHDPEPDSVSWLFQKKINCPRNFRPPQKSVHHFSNKLAQYRRTNFHKSVICQRVLALARLVPDDVRLARVIDELRRQQNPSRYSILVGVLFIGHALRLRKHSPPGVSRTVV